MVMMLTLEEGSRLVAVAREVLDSYLRSGEVKGPDLHGGLSERRGAFCTLTTYPDGDLRGCVGLPYPDKPLGETVVSAAIGAAGDSRFPPLRLEELSGVTVEVSVLTSPVEVEVASHQDYPTAVEPPKDGLILRYGAFSGLLLPQVWEQLPDPVEFLGVLCYKAGIPRSDAWKDDEARLYRFRAQVFSEQEPMGEILEV
jgi:uncharacterized protein (TIGR00296 family)